MTTTPVRRRDFETADIALTHEVLTRSYVDHRPRISRPGPDFVFRLRTAAAGDLDVHRLEYLGAVDAHADAFDFVTTVVLFAGSYRIGDQRFAAGDALLVPVGAPLAVA